ncbi:hypothetical protein [Aliikangiella sp. G2MR2-5]|uniref:hypothetical protein n=1 Tax=Aliikangiella sp. G2MR2-5 TaxID=2788943 RepID=UPI0018ABE798|nr:hypothetical protein [Aliikangiella sp. G2MR2-5]
MKSTNKKINVCPTNSKNFLLKTSCLISLLLCQTVFADVTMTGGFVSDYYFRGWNLGDGGAYASVDYSQDGFYAGTWWIDDSTGGNDGLETDYYLGYGKEYDSFSWSVGYTRYEYTYVSDFEQELSLNLTYGDFSFDLISGDDDDGAIAEDYSVFVATYSHSAFELTLGAGDYSDLDDASWTWAEVSFSSELANEVSASLHLGIKSDDLIGSQDDGYIYLDISKSFDL